MSEALDKTRKRTAKVGEKILNFKIVYGQYNLIQLQRLIFRTQTVHARRNSMQITQVAPIAVCVFKRFPLNALKQAAEVQNRLT